MFRGTQEEGEALWDQIAGMRTAKEALEEAVREGSKIAWGSDNHAYSSFCLAARR